MANESKGRNDNKMKKKKKKNDDLLGMSASLHSQPSFQETFSFVFTSRQQKVLFTVGAIGSAACGLTLPLLALTISRNLSDLSGIGSSDTLAPIYPVVYRFVLIGIMGGVGGWISVLALEKMSFQACATFKSAWFKALLNQDAAFHQVYNVPELAISIASHGETYRRGVGQRLGEGVEYMVGLLGGITFAFYSSWKMTLILLFFVTPVITLGTSIVVHTNRTKAERSSASYQTAASVAYATLSSIRTVLSLNAIPTQIEKYEKETTTAFYYSTKSLFKEGVGTGLSLGGVVLLIAATSIFGGAIWLSKLIRDTGCDPSSSVKDNMNCEINGYDIFGAMMGILMASMSLSHVSSVLESVSTTRHVASLALKTIHGRQTNMEETIYENDNSETKGSDSTTNGNETVLDELCTNPEVDMQKDVEKQHQQQQEPKKVKAILPKHEIQALSHNGQKPTNVEGAIQFQNVKFHYPTRPGVSVLNGLSIDITAGQTVAFVGPSGGGKSTIVRLLERFFDPTEGSVSIDGINVKDLNISYLRQCIGYVGQEPKLFATSILQNIQYGNPNATMEEIEQAAKMANAHDFISSFPDGYNTHVGDLGAQLSGGQKQRIAIARVLVGNPTILLLDEATSALDSESELIVQEALNNVMALQKRTTIIIAHRLSTIQHADTIAVVEKGTIVEQGSHDHLVQIENGIYKKLLDRQSRKKRRRGRKSSFKSDENSNEGNENNNEQENNNEHGGQQTGDDLDTSSEELVISTASSTTTEPNNDGVEMPLQVLIKEPSMVAGNTHIEFKNVTFSYPSRRTKQVMKNFNLKIRKGETVALVGTSGGGKSTTVSLLERFYDPEQGTVKYYGHDIKSLNIDWYRAQFGYVGQEPTLFSGSIAENIAYGIPNPDRKTIEDVARKANAHDFIMLFPNGYDTLLDDNGTQLSGGQKQRIAIARAIYKSPKVLLLDEATSALDNDSEAIVQAALDQLMASDDITSIVVAHKLSTIHDADRIVFIHDGEVKETGNHDELLEIPNGYYKRLVEAQNNRTTMKASESSRTLGALSKQESSLSMDITNKTLDTVTDIGTINEENDDESEMGDGSVPQINFQRARQMAAPDTLYLFIGFIGALMGGSGFPLWGVVQSQIISVLYHRVEYCDDNEGIVPDGFDTCEEFWSWDANRLRNKSFFVAMYAFLLFLGITIGGIITSWGLGTARERLNKRVRDDAFKSMLRQEVGYFDNHNVGSLASQLQEDAAKLHAFSGEPLRSLAIALSSVLAGTIIAFFFMWPFALFSIACLPFLILSNSRIAGSLTGSEGEVGGSGSMSAEGILVETLLNMPTINALRMEEKRLEDYHEALENLEPKVTKEIRSQACMNGAARAVGHFIKAIQYLWGGFLLFKYSHLYSFNNFALAYFAFFYSLFGLGVAMQHLTDRGEATDSANRIFSLIDRKSSIDPISNVGKKLD